MGTAMNAVWGALKGLLGMKKTWAALATLVVWLVSKFGLNLPMQEVASATALMGSLFVGYLLQDLGKGDVEPKRIRDALFQMFSSKKAIATFVTVAVWVTSRVGFNIDPETISYVLNAVSGLVLGIGFQDMGKEKQASLSAASTSSRKKK
jgi:hypothetical protein